jgi:hypothetical protein
VPWPSAATISGIGSAPEALPALCKALVIRCKAVPERGALLSMEGRRPKAISDDRAGGGRHTGAGGI